MTKDALQPARIHHQLIVAGFGGQGVLLLGQTLAEAVMREGREVAWTPAYGPEMRGGPAFCTVVISSEPIGSPVVASPDTAIIMDQPSLQKYQQSVRASGVILFNSSLINPELARSDVPCYAIPANRLAEDIGDARIANMIMLGAFLHVSTIAQPETVLASLADALPARRQHLLPMNERALSAGARAAEAVIVPA